MSSSHKRAITVDLKPRKRQFRRTRSLDFSFTKTHTVSPTPYLFRIHSTVETKPTPVDMDTSRSYRVGSPGLIAPPFDTQRVDQIPTCDINELLSLVKTVLEQAHVHVSRRSIIRQFRPENGTNTSPAILSIESDLSRDGQYAHWKSGFGMLRHLLNSFGLEEMLIEIVDRRVSLECSMGPILECTPEMFRGWQKFASLVLEEIRERDWIAIDTVARDFGVKHPLTMPTVVITARDADDEIWRRDIVPRLRKSLPPGMDIDVFYASALLYASSESSGQDKIAEDTIAEDARWPAIYSTMADYSPAVKMGASIGLDESANSATVGAVVELCDNTGNQTICGLTNHHVVAQAPGSISQECPIGHFLSPDHPICHDGLVKVVAPSRPDHERFLKHTTMLRDELQKTLAELSNAYRQESRQYAYTVDELNKASADWEMLTNKPDQLLGTVWATSGYRICDNAGYSKAEKLHFSTVGVPDSDNGLTGLKATISGRVLDFGLNWALIKITSERTLSELTPHIPGGFKLRPSAPATQYTRICQNKSYNVAKKGRTTGWTRGTITQIGSLLSLRSDGINIVPVDLTNRFGDRNVILAFGVFHHEKSRDFMMGGDSGSCVLLDKGGRKATIVGLLFASNEQTRVSYMMPMDMVIRDIEHVTGHTVVQPTFVEYAD